MGFFGSKTSSGGTSSPGPRPSGPVAGLSIIGSGMTVRGDIETPGVVKVEGTIDGFVSARQQVLVAKGGVVHGDIDTREAIVGGSVNGAIRATERVEIQTGATVLGDITTRRVAVAEGGTINGNIRMGEGAVNAALEVRTSVSAAPRIEPRSAAGPSLVRPSVPVARVAVPPRAAPPSAGQSH